MNATGLNFLLIVSLLWVYPRWILLASAICAFFNLALILVVHLRNALLITALILVNYVEFVMAFLGKFFLGVWR